MKNKFLIGLVAAALLVPNYRLRAGEPDPAMTELKDLVTRIVTSLNEGKRSEADQADHIKEFDALLAKYKGQTNDAAEIALMKTGLYVNIFKKIEQGTEMLQQLQRDYPGTPQAKKAEQIIASIKQGEESRKIAAEAAMAQSQDNLPVGTNFPDFDVKDLNGRPLSIANFKGKIVMVDFWATWCPPCRAEAPNVAQAYQKFHDKGFEIIGISLDQEGSKDKVISFAKENNMPWAQYYDGKGWKNDLAVKYGINSIPAAFLLDGTGKIIAKGESIRGDDLEPAVKKALGSN